MRLLTHVLTAHGQTVLLNYMVFHLHQHYTDKCLTDCSQMQSYSLNFSGDMPPDPSNISMFHMQSVSYPFSLRMLPSKGGFKGGSRGTLDFHKQLLNFKSTKLTCTANVISLTANFQSLSLALVLGSIPVFLARYSINVAPVLI